MYRENWKDIDGYNGLYQISNYGRVKSLFKEIKYATGPVHSYNETIRKIVINKKNGYCYIGLTVNGKQTHHRVHRLVASAFIPNMLNLPQVNHIDYNKENNSFDNLEWVDGFRQQQHAALKPNRKWQSHRKGKCGRLNPKSKPVIQYSFSGQLINSFESANMAAKSVDNSNQSKISNCCLGHRKTHAGFIWKFNN